MKHEKAYYTSLPPIEGFTWSGYWDNLHHFVKQDEKGFLDTRCTDTDIEDGNLQQMIKLGYSK